MKNDARGAKKKNDGVEFVAVVFKRDIDPWGRSATSSQVHEVFSDLGMHLHKMQDPTEVTFVPWGNIAHVQLKAAKPSPMVKAPVRAQKSPRRRRGAKT
jgi:hypothetical protein